MRKTSAKVASSNAACPAEIPATETGRQALDVTAVEVISIEDLALDQANLREHDERNSTGIESSLKRFGAGRSIVLDSNGVVRAGNGTVEAARRAGIRDVLVIDPKPGQLVAVRRKDWSPTEATAYAIADNRLTDLSKFNSTDLASTLSALQSEDFDLTAVGFNNAEVDALLEGLASEALGEEIPVSDGLGGSAPASYLAWGPNKVPLTEEEVGLLNAALKRHQDAAGTSYGFVVGVFQNV